MVGYKTLKMEVLSYQKERQQVATCPRTVRTPALIDRVKYSIEKDPRQSVRKVAHEIEMRVPYDLIHRGLTATEELFGLGSC